jgi:SOS response regulatory protein OraA/RecX
MNSSFRNSQNSHSKIDRAQSRRLQDIWAYTGQQVARREYTRTTLKRLLDRKGYTSEEVHETLDRCERLKLIDDHRFTEMAVRSLIQRGKGPHYVSAWLRQKGITQTPSQIEQSLLDSQEHDPQALERQKQRLSLKIQRKYPDWKESVSTRQKAMAYLVRQGFGIDQARRLLEDQKL